MENQESLKKLLDLIRKELGVSEMEIASKCRERERVWARYMFVYFSRQYLEWSTPDIYKYINTDRTNLYHMKEKHLELLGNDKEYQFIFYRIKNVMDSEYIAPGVRLTDSELITSKLFNKRMLIGIDKEVFAC